MGWVAAEGLEADHSNDLTCELNGSRVSEQARGPDVWRLPSHSLESFATAQDVSFATAQTSASLLRHAQHARSSRSYPDRYTLTWACCPLARWAEATDSVGARERLRRASRPR